MQRCFDAKLLKKFICVDGKFQEETMYSENMSVTETDFDWALRVKNFGALERILLEENKKISTPRDKFGRNLLHLASLSGNKELVKILFNHPEKLDIDINSLDDNKMTAYQYATLLKHGKVQKVMEKHVEMS